MRNDFPFLENEEMLKNSLEVLEKLAGENISKSFQLIFWKFFREIFSENFPIFPGKVSGK
jgi:hypothetical protein